MKNSKFERKQIIVALVIFLFIFILSLASNYIRWDETPLEQTIWALPLFFGMILQLPFFHIMASVVGKSDLFGFELLSVLTPLLTAIVYSALYIVPVWALSKNTRVRAAKTVLSHMIFFLLGLLVTAIYHHWFVNPIQVAHLSQICDETQLGYPGDWVLSVFFPVIPILGILVIIFLVLRIANSK